jgi:hypothetical protein
MKQLIALPVLACFFLMPLWGDDAAYQARIQSAILELEMDDLLALWFTDADTGQPVTDALVAIEKKGSIRTNEDGLAVFPVIEDGEHRFIIQKEGYITYQDSFAVFAGTIFFNKYSIPRLLSIDNIKIVLDWDAAPRDLDAHLVKEGRYHISYRDAGRSEDGTAWLDRDDMDGFGPETITVTELDKQAAYRYFVFDYSNRLDENSSRLSASKAVVRVFVNNKFQAIYQIPPNRRGTAWNVFNIVNGEIQTVDEYE